MTEASLSALGTPCSTSVRATVCNTIQTSIQKVCDYGRGLGRNRNKSENSAHNTRFTAARIVLLLQV